MSLLEDLVKSEIQKIPGPKRGSTNHTMVLCPFHSEKTPSGRVLHHADGVGVGNFKCYSCGHTCGWNELAKVLGLQTYGKSEKLLDSLEVPKSSMDSYEGRFLGKSDPDFEELKFYELTNSRATASAGLTQEKWRGFRLDFLATLGIKLVKVVDTGRFYVYLPIQVKSKTLGYIKAQIRKPYSKSIPSYINSKGGWSLKSGLFPYDQAVALMKSLGLSTIVLVEGPRDALRLIRFGIPAVCIMGTHSWSKSKLRKLEFTGASRVVLMLDGDAAGKAATRLILTGCTKDGTMVAPPLEASFQVKVVRLWNVESPTNEKYDPGNCPSDILVKVQRLLR